MIGTPSSQAMMPFMMSSCGCLAKERREGRAGSGLPPRAPRGLRYGRSSSSASIQPFSQAR